MSAYLTFTIHNQEQKLSCGAVFTVGREFSCDLMLEDKAVSRNHAIIRQLGSGDYYVIDNGSANGTFINGTRITVPTLLNNGDSLQFGGFQASFVSGGKPRRPYSLHDPFDEDKVAEQKITTIPITVLEAYIREFTPLSKTVSIQQLTGLTNEWFHGVADCVQGFRGVLDKIVSHCMFARWNHDIGTDHSVIRALHTACGIQHMTQSLQQKYPQLRYPFRAGIRIYNTFAGVRVGQGNMVISNINNFASLREYNSSKVLQKDIVISKSAYENLPLLFWSGREQTILVDGKKKLERVVGYAFDEVAAIL